MSDTDPASPQFETVEYTPTPGGCVLCNQPIGGKYYRVNGEMACSACVEREHSALDTASKYYSRALIYGIGAAIIGMIGYALFEIATGWIIGYVSLGVGWLVGKAMLKGSRGFGGRRYQITAALLTYAAVSLAAIPAMIHQVAQQKKNSPPPQQQHFVAPAPEASRQTPSNLPQSTDVTATPESNSPNRHPSRRTLNKRRWESAKPWAYCSSSDWRRHFLN